MTASPEQNSIISGIGISRIGRRTGIPGLDLTVEASNAAIRDAGLTPADIDGLSTMGETPPDEVRAALGLETSYSGGGMGTGGLLTPLMSAILAVAEGRARHVLVYRTVQMMGGAIPIPPSAPATGAPPAPAPPPAPPAPAAAADPEAPPAPAPGAAGGMMELLTYHAYSAANWLSMHCRRHMHLYGTTKEQLGALAVNSRANAALNPLAVYREPMTLDDYLSARIVSSPFGLFDCDVPIDGSIALVVSGQVPRTLADCDHPVRVQAMGGTPGTGGWYLRPDYPKMASVDATAELWSRTDLKPGDVDFAELYDGFTFLTFAWLEAFGFCGEGEAGPFVDDPARIGINGTFPLNTYGGQLSAGRMHGYWVVHEACLQLRGQAGDRQVARHEVAAVGTGGGPIAGALLLTS